jgi:hypothetical protein
MLAAVEVRLGEGAVAVPGARHARLAAGVRQLDGWNGSMAFQEGSNSS